MTCIDAIRDVFQNKNEVLTTNDVINRIYSKYPDKPWKASTISAHLIGLSANHPSSRYYPSIRQRAFLFSLGNGKYRLWDPEEDGTWTVTEVGVKLIDDNSGANLVEDVEQENIITAVSLEKDLENALVSNLEQLEGGLSLYQKNGISGHQLNTNAVGRIDILAIDKEGNYVVIELKAGEADDKVCGQILKYMGWVKKELANGKPVRGIIIANSFSEQLKYAVDAVPNITLKLYKVHFTFSDV
jgi:hypothetical protein